MHTRCKMPDSKSELRILTVKYVILCSSVAKNPYHRDKSLRVATAILTHWLHHGASVLIKFS